MGQLITSLGLTALGGLMFFICKLLGETNYTGVIFIWIISVLLLIDFVYNFVKDTVNDSKHRNKRKY